MPIRVSNRLRFDSTEKLEDRILLSASAPGSAPDESVVQGGTLAPTEIAPLSKSELKEAESLLKEKQKAEKEAFKEFEDSTKQQLKIEKEDFEDAQHAEKEVFKSEEKNGDTTVDKKEFEEAQKSEKKTFESSLKENESALKVEKKALEERQKAEKEALKNGVPQFLVAPLFSNGVIENAEIAKGQSTDIPFDDKTSPQSSTNTEPAVVQASEADTNTEESVAIDEDVTSESESLAIIDSPQSTFEPNKSQVVDANLVSLEELALEQSTNDSSVVNLNDGGAQSSKPTTAASAGNPKSDVANNQSGGGVGNPTVEDRGERDSQTQFATVNIDQYPSTQASAEQESSSAAQTRTAPNSTVSPEVESIARQNAPSPNQSEPAQATTTFDPPSITPDVESSDTQLSSSQTPHSQFTRATNTTNNADQFLVPEATTETAPNITNRSSNAVTVSSDSPTRVDLSSTNIADQNTSINSAIDNVNQGSITQGGSSGQASGSQGGGASQGAGSGVSGINGSSQPITPSARGSILASTSPVPKNSPLGDPRSIDGPLKDMFDETMINNTSNADQSSDPGQPSASTFEPPVVVSASKVEAPKSNPSSSEKAKTNIANDGSSEESSIDRNMQDRAQQADSALPSGGQVENAPTEKGNAKLRSANESKVVDPGTDQAYQNEPVEEIAEEALELKPMDEARPATSQEDRSTQSEATDESPTKSELKPASEARSVNDSEESTSTPYGESEKTNLSEETSDASAKPKPNERNQQATTNTSAKKEEREASRSESVEGIATKKYSEVSKAQISIDALPSSASPKSSVDSSQPDHSRLNAVAVLDVEEVQPAAEPISPLDATANEVTPVDPTAEAAITDGASTLSARPKIETNEKITDATESVDLLYRMDTESAAPKNDSLVDADDSILTEAGSIKKAPSTQDAIRTDSIAQNSIATTSSNKGGDAQTSIPPVASIVKSTETTSDSMKASSDAAIDPGLTELASNSIAPSTNESDGSASIKQSSTKSDSSHKASDAQTSTPAMASIKKEKNKGTTSELMDATSDTAIDPGLTAAATSTPVTNTTDLNGKVPSNQSSIATTSNNKTGDVPVSAPVVASIAEKSNDTNSESSNVSLGMATDPTLTELASNTTAPSSNESIGSSSEDQTSTKATSNNTDNDVQASTRELASIAAETSNEATSKSLNPPSASITSPSLASNTTSLGTNDSSSSASKNQTSTTVTSSKEASNAKASTSALALIATESKNETTVKPIDTKVAPTQSKPTIENTVETSLVTSGNSAPSKANQFNAANSSLQMTLTENRSSTSQSSDPLSPVVPSRQGVNPLGIAAAIELPVGPSMSANTASFEARVMQTSAPANISGINAKQDSRPIDSGIRLVSTANDSQEVNWIRLEAIDASLPLRPIDTATLNGSKDGTKEEETAFDGNQEKTPLAQHQLNPKETQSELLDAEKSDSESEGTKTDPEQGELDIPNEQVPEQKQSTPAVLAAIVLGMIVPRRYRRK